MTIITKLNKDKKYRAHRAYRRAAKQAVKSGRDVNEKPRLTGWDIA